MPGPRPRPPLQLLREGNPGRRPVRQGARVPPAPLAEPDWGQWFPLVPDREAAAVNSRCQQVAQREWRRVVPALSAATGLSDLDATTMADYCRCVARLDQCERDISTRGLLMHGERGWQKNSATTIAAQYRQQLRAYVGELGLSPSARARLSPPEVDDHDDDVFD